MHRGDRCRRHVALLGQRQQLIEHGLRLLALACARVLVDEFELTRSFRRVLDANRVTAGLSSTITSAENCGA